MAKRIEDYALIGNRETVALVGRDGSIDWLGMPRFDSPACFAALLGTPEHGRWQVAPVASAGARVTRRYRNDTLVLETEFETETGAVRVIDFMARRDGASDLIRLVRGLHGSVEMQTELVVRFEYGSAVPWVERSDDGRLFITAGPDRLVLVSTTELQGEDMKTTGRFRVAAGEDVCFTLSWSPSYRAVPPPIDVAAVLAAVEAESRNWMASIDTAAQASEAVRRSLLTLKALTHRETGGILAAGTTSLPEQIGGSRNWDYRYCWLRDATFTLFALLRTGFVDEAVAWREWLVRAVAGDPAQLQIMYGIAGERRLDEYELPWLPGFEGSAPVRVGNGAAGQLQLDVYGELIGALYLARCAGLPASHTSWALECRLIEQLESLWEQPDDGIWEVRGERRHFTHSKVMAWVAFDRAVRSAQEFGLPAPIERWASVRDRVHAQVCARGFDAGQNSFVQSYGAAALDASLLLIPIVGFLPPEDDRVRGTLAAVERLLLRDGLVLRYDTVAAADGLPPGEGAFLACSFWLVDNYVLQGRLDEAHALFDRLLGYRNDVGLLAEEYDPVGKRQLGNFPQAFSHVALINSAHRLQGGAASVKPPTPRSPPAAPRSGR